MTDHVPVPDELDRRFRDAAAASGLVEVSYDVVDSPLGPLTVCVSERGLYRISFENHAEEELENVARRHGGLVLRLSRPVEPARRQLTEYFEGARRTFDLPLDLEETAGFNRTVLAELARIPYGGLTTYGTLAARVGRPKAPRAVGTVMNRNPIPIVLPCHRVVGSTGSLTGYAGGLWMKELLLELEGALPRRTLLDA